MVWMVLGKVLGGAYIAYATLLLLACMGGHVALLLLYVIQRGRGENGRAFVVLEVLYGLVNPVLYLLVLQPAFFANVSKTPVTAACWAVLLGYWTMRVAGQQLSRGVIRAVLAAAAICVVAVAARDAALAPHDLVNGPTKWLFLPLYAFPLAIVAVQLRFPETVCFRRGALRPGVVVSAAIVSFAVIGWKAPHPWAARATLSTHHDTIVASATRARIDPRLVAAIIYVNQTSHTNALEATLEEVVASTWVMDAKSHLGLADAIDPSIGLAQIKPVTAQTAMMIRKRAAIFEAYGGKEFREVETETVRRVAKPRHASIAAPISGGKAEVVEALLDPVKNVEACTFLLALYAAQWEADGNPIRDRPEILATLYSLGFAKSHPKAHPRANEFGERIARVMQEPWMIQEFGAAYANNAK